jgi:Universal stress protein UspA and related nucleotide-binding proteins
MSDSNKLKVLLYSDGSQHSLSAAVYAANLLRNIPDMHLTVLYVQDNIESFKGGDSDPVKPSPIDPKLDWVKHLMGEADSDKIIQYSEILDKTSDLFSMRGYDVNQQVIYSDSSISETAKAILNYSTKNGFELIIMGTRGLTSLKGLIHGSLTHIMINKSSIPVLLVKKLPREFVDRYCTGVDVEEQFNVLLYSDGSHQAFSAAVYTANLFKKIPNMHLTVIQVQESDEGSKGTTSGWIDTWPVSPTSEWMKQVMDVLDAETKQHYHEILAKTNEIFFKRDHKVKHQVLYTTNNITNVADAILDYATKNSFNLLINGTRGLSSLNGLIFGSFAHNLLNKANVPVLLIKKLPQDFIDSYLSDKES